MTKSQGADPWAVGWTMRALVLVTFLAALFVPMLPGPTIVAVTTGAAGELTQVEEPITILLSTPVPTPLPPQVTPTPHVTRIGIIAGHTGSDSGAICDDGLEEVQVNAEIARRVVARLSAHGWEAELLEEFDPRLDGYKADALLAIHADSCNVPGKTGFKIARAESSYIPSSEDNLVDCISRHYAEETGLPFDPYTITYDMTRYHAYYEIDPSTPAAIIEAGFMLDDREILTERPEVVAQGIVDGLICFVEGETP